MPKTKIPPSPSLLEEIENITDDSLPAPVIEKMKAWIAQEARDKAKGYGSLAIAWFSAPKETVKMVRKLDQHGWITIIDKSSKIVRVSRISINNKTREICQ